MQIYQAIILGIIQGLTEFLPISSSAHLNLFPFLLKWQEIPETFDVALHIGTLLAIIIFFFKDWVRLIVGGYKQVVKKEKTVDGKIFWYLVLATIPAGVLSLVLAKISEKIFERSLNVEMIVISITLIIMGIVLYIVDKRAKSKTKLNNITLKQALAIGMSQSIAAAFPGVSRSGITITIARELGLDRESSARFSFLLAAPITAAAILVNIGSFALTSISFWLGILVSFIVGMVVIKVLLEYLKKSSFKAFAIYRIIIGIFMIIAILIKL